MTPDKLQLVIASNRLPCTLVKDDGQWRVRPGSGGLVTAMAPVLSDRGGVWIGWPGTVTEDEANVEGMLQEEGARLGYTLRPVMLSHEEREAFYHGFANEIIWPLFHSLDERCNFDPSYWETYRLVNAKFADVIARNVVEHGSYIWVHDYHLMLVGSALREAGIDASVAFFLHTPFPPVDIFQKLPWRFDVLRGLLDFDLLGFQTYRDRANFVRCVRTLLPECRVQGRGQVQSLSTPEREIRIGAFPISIDYSEFEKGAKAEEVGTSMERLRQEYGGRKIVFGVDRLDYTKGVPYRLKAFGLLLERHPELHRKVSLVQVIVPSRTSIQAYESLREEIGELVGEINGTHTQPGWVPIHYIYRSLNRPELLAYYRAADVALVTPLIDGMNLVAKEYCACNIEEQGVLVLSEFAGAAAELQKGAVLVNPYDIEGVAEGIRQALTMESDERRDRMRRMRQTVRKRNVFHWLDSFLSASIARRLDDFPPVNHYVPSERPRGAVSMKSKEKEPFGDAGPNRVPMTRQGQQFPPAAQSADQTTLPSGV